MNDIKNCNANGTRFKMCRNKYNKCDICDGLIYFKNIIVKDDDVEKEISEKLERLNTKTKNQ